MTPVPAHEVRSFVLQEVSAPLRRIGLEPEAIADDFDLYASGVIDSLGLIELIAALEERFGLEIDFEELDPDDLTLIGPFSRYVEEKSGSSGS